MDRQDEDDVVYFSVPVDAATFAWLERIAEASHAPPALVIASIIQDVRADDERAEIDVPAPGAVTLN